MACYRAPMMTPEQFSALRKRTKLTQGQFAAAVGVNRVTVWRWETGKVEPSPVMIDHVRRVTAALVERAKGRAA